MGPSSASFKAQRSLSELPPTAATDSPVPRSSSRPWLCLGPSLGVPCGLKASARQWFAPNMTKNSTESGHQQTATERLKPQSPNTWNTIFVHVPIGHFRAAFALRYGGHGTLGKGPGTLSVYLVLWDFRVGCRLGFGRCRCGSSMCGLWGCLGIAEFS